MKPFQNNIFLCLVLLLAFKGTLTSQNTIDTLNELNSKGKKSGFYPIYFDSLFYDCAKQNAKYYGYIYYHKGKALFEPLARRWKTDDIAYKPYNDSNQQNGPILLNGEIFHFTLQDTLKKCNLYYAFKYGRETAHIQYFNSRNEKLPEADIYYLDSLFENKFNSYLYYKKDKNLPIYKQYEDYDHAKALSERTYFVNHKDFKYLMRFKIGGTFSTAQPTDKSLKIKNFAEIGLAQKFISGTHIDTTNRTYQKNLAVFHSLNYALLGSYTNKQFCLAPKVTYAYTLIFGRAEAGLINYTDFVKNDPRIMLGIGLSIFGYFNEMLYFTIPLTNNQIVNVPRFSFCLTFN